MAVKRQVTNMLRYIVTVLTNLVASVLRSPQFPEGCEVPVHIQSGWVCGVKSVYNGTEFASFLGVPYAAQPLGERRFSELQPVEPWNSFYDASTAGPVCPQYDVLYGKLVNKSRMSEACMYANIHVPIHAMPQYHLKSKLFPSYGTGFIDKKVVGGTDGLPILVFIHGGGFAFGSGGPELFGPEYMIHSNFIIFTYNYRINVFGFLSLNSSCIPGNNGLRDSVTFLKWVRANARCFGGDPDDITLGGQSAGAVTTHLLTLSRAAKGLFRRAILMDDTAIPSFYTPSPQYAKYVANLFLSNLGVTATDPKTIHQQLVRMPLQKIMEANKRTQDTMGILCFFPVIETPVPGFTTILDTDPEILLAKGVGKDIPLLIGYTNKEAETLRPNFERLDILSCLKDDPTMILPVSVRFNVPRNIALVMAKLIMKRYFGDEPPTLDKYIEIVSDTYFVYPMLKFVKKRSQLSNAASLFLYRFGYTADFSVIKEALGLGLCKGAPHIEVMTFVFRANALDGTKGFSPLSPKDQSMVDWMTGFVRNFIYCTDPVCCQGSETEWPPVNTIQPIHYQRIDDPKVYRFTNISEREEETVKFFDNLQKLAESSCYNDTIAN